MSDVAIRVENLSKRYRIGLKEEMHDTMVSAMVDFISQPLKNLRRLRRLSRFEENGRDPEDIIWALKDVSFEVKRGEVVGIIGRNGAGKTTLLKILSHITEPTSGRAEISGRVASLLAVGTGFHAELTGRENVYLNGTILGMKKTEVDRKFDEIVGFSGIEKFIDTPVKHYSSGMYVRLAFSVAAHLEPEVLLVDEVLSVGDAEFQKKCLGKMQDVAGEGRTVLFVSHNMRAVERLCNRAILLENGKVAENGPVRQVIASYLQSGMQQLGERVWTDPAGAPGNDVVRLRAVRALNAQGEAASEFKVAEPFYIEVEFWVLTPGYKLDAGFYFYDESGTLIFVTGDYQDNAWHNRTRPMGIHRSKCHVPGNLLNEGTMSVLAAVATNPHTLHAIERDAITLRIVDDLEPGGARGHYTREWPGGVIRPLLKWTFDFEPLDNEEIERRDITTEVGA